MIVWDIRQKTMWCELFDNNNSRISQVAWSPEDGLHLLTGMVWSSHVMMNETILVNDMLIISQSLLPLTPSSGQ